MLIKKNDKWLIYAPEKLRPAILKYWHESLFGGHLADFKMLASLNNTFSWINQAEDVKCFVRSCPTCQEYKPILRKTCLLGTFDPRIPFQYVFLDIVEVCKSRKGNNYALVLIDGFSGFFYSEGPKRTTTESCIKALTAILAKSCIPQTIVLDQQSALTSKGFKSLAKRLDIKLEYISPAVHQSSLAESACKKLNSILKFYAKHDLSNWCEILHMGVASLNNSHTKTGKTPTELLFGISSKNIPNSLRKLLEEPTPKGTFQGRRTEIRTQHLTTRTKLRESQH